MPASLTSSYELHEWSFDKLAITQLLFDPSSARLQAWSLHESLELRCGAPFALTVDGQSSALDPSLPAVNLAPFLRLLGEHLLRIEVHRSGRISLSTIEGTSLTIEPHPTWEAWELGGTALGESGYLCDPGGGSPWG